MSYFLVRLGEGAKYGEVAKKGGYVAIGWNQLPNLKTISSLEKIKKGIQKSCPQCSISSVANQAGQAYRFGFGIKKGDTVMVPLGGRLYLVGRASEYYYEEAPDDGCPFRHRRNVEWLQRELSKDDMTTNLAYALGSSLTVYSLDAYAAEIEALISGRQSITPAELPQTIRGAIYDGLMSLDGKQFEEFVRHLLSVLGFQAETTQYVGDKGVDVNGVLDAEGLAEVTLRIQVKRVSSTIGIKDVQAIRGATGTGEHACLVALSGFSNQAIEEASLQGRAPVKLIDGDELAAIILKHFESIGEEYRELFPIRRKKELEIEEQFEFIDQNAGHAVPVHDTAAGSHDDVDTLVCSAKEDGFKSAFLGMGSWWAVRISPKMIPHIKYLAMYQVAPISGITYYGEVAAIEPFEDTGKYKIVLKGKPKRLEHTVPLGKNRILKPQGAKYAKLEVILGAKTIDDVF
jgi:restriction system protein